MAENARVRRVRSVSADELRMWRAVVRDAVPFSDRALSADEPPDPPPAARPEPVPPAPAASPPPAAHRPLAHLTHGDAPGLDKATANRLRRGRLPVEGAIDLHGLTQDGAHAALSDYIVRAQTAGKRCVLVVTGKGLREGTGILRAMVPRWLNEPELRRLVLSFTHARPKDGGEGALYVLLKRQRS